jgi:hypothetical protein
MATSQPAEAKKKPKIEGGPQFPCRSFTPKKPSFAAPTQGLEHIIFDNTGTAKAASTFNLNIKALSEHIVNRLKFDGPLTALAICKLKEPTIIFLKDPTDTTNLVETTKWQRKYNHAHDQQKWWDENTQKIYNLVMQHSMPEMKTKLLTMDSWAKTSATQDGIALLKTIRDISHKKDSGANATTILDLVCMDKDMFLVHQAPTKLLSSYLAKFKGTVDVVESLNGSPWSHPAATKIVFDELYGPADLALAKANTSSEYQLAATEAQRRYLATLFFHGLSNEAHRTSRRRSTTMPSQDPTLSLTLTTRSSSSRTSTNPPTSNATPEAKEGAALPSCRKARPLQRGQQQRQQRRLWMLPPNMNPTRSQGRRTTKERCLPTVRERRTASTVATTITGLSTAPI